MKISIHKSITVSILTLCTLGSYVHPAKAVLLGYYTFDNGTANDVSGNGNNGVLSSPTAPQFTSASAWQGQSASFNGSSWITVPININPSTSPQITMGGWFRATDASYISAVISHDNGPFDRTIGIDNRIGPSPNGPYRWSTFIGTGVLPGSTVELNTWNFVSLRHNQATGELILDVNQNRYKQTGVTFTAGDSNTRIGDNPNFDTPFRGLGDNVFIYNEVLSDAQIAAIQSQGGVNAAVPFEFSPSIGLVSLAGIWFASNVLKRRRFKAET